MKWIGISGGWRKINEEIEELVRKIVREIITRGDGIVSGGALGVDFITLREAMKLDKTGKQIKIFLPSSLDIYASHYRKRAKEGVITEAQAESLIKQLAELKKLNSDSLIENYDNTVVDKEVYYERNLKVVEASDELIAFRIKTEDSEGMGTKDTIDKAEQKNIPIKIFQFNLTEGD